MGMLVDGRWQDEDHWPKDAQGNFVRSTSLFREAVGSQAFPVETGRYHLLLAKACPWCHRTDIVRSLLGLQHAISTSTVDPLMREGGWRFGDSYPDPLFGSAFVHEWYTRADPAYTGRVTVPILWDREHATIVCNESEDIVRMMNTVFRPLARKAQADLYPEALRGEIDAVNVRVYNDLNNGVYKCGFAGSQAAYDRAVTALFATVDHLEERLANRTYLVGDTLTEADVRLFVTAIRFDAVYHGHFKCNLRRWIDYPNLSAWLARLWEMPAFRDTTDLVEIKAHYYRSHLSINPTGIVPIGPAAVVGAR